MIADVRRCRCRSRDKCTANIAPPPNAEHTYSLSVSLISLFLSFLSRIRTYIGTYRYVYVLYGYNDLPQGEDYTRLCQKCIDPTARGAIPRALIFCYDAEYRSIKRPQRFVRSSIAKRWRRRNKNPITVTHNVGSNETRVRHARYV